jgi:hypothetical protein
LLKQEKEEKRNEVQVSPINISKKILIFIALVVGTTLILRPLQINLRDQMERLRDNFIIQTEETWGRKIQYSSMGPSIFGVLDIRNVLILREDNSVFLSISRLRLSFSLFELLRGNTLDAFKSVRIDRPVLSLDFEKDTDLKERFASTDGLQGTIPEGLSIRIRNGEWDFSDSFGRLKFQGVGFDASVRNNRIGFQGRWNLEASIAGGNNPMAFLSSANSQPLRASMNALINGEYFTDIEEGRATVTIPLFSGDFFRSRPLSFNFALSNGNLEIRNANSTSPLTFSLLYDLENNSLRSNLEMENFSPDSVLILTGPWRDYNPALAMRFSGDAVFEKEDTGYLQFSIGFTGGGTGNPLLGQPFFNIIASGNSNEIIIDAFDFRSNFGSLRFSGGGNLNPAGAIPFAPYGSLSLSNFRFHGNSGLSGNISLNTHEDEIRLFSNNLAAGDIGLSEMDMSLAWEQQGFTFVFSALRSIANGVSDIRHSSFLLQGSADFDPRQIQANLRLDSFSAGDILGLIEPLVSIPLMPSFARSLAKDISLTTEVFFTTDYEQILYNAPHFSAVYKGFKDILINASVSGTDRRMELSSCYILWDNETAEISGVLDYFNINAISFSLGASIRNLTYFFNGHIHEMRNLNIRGSYGFEVLLNELQNGGYSGSARGDNIPLPNGDNNVYLSYDCSLVFNSPSSWRAGIDKFEIISFSTPLSSPAVLNFTGTANERGMNIPNFFFDDGRGSLAGNIALNWDPSYEFCGFSVEIAGNNRSEFYSLSGIYRNNRLALSFSGQGMQFARFSAQNAIVDGSLRLSWESSASFEAEAIISSYALHHHNKVLQASANINIDNDKLITEQLRIIYSDLEANIPLIRIDRSASVAETEAGIWGFVGEKPVYFLIRGDARFNQSATWVDLFRDFRSMNASLLFRAASYDNIIADEPFSFTLSHERENSGFTTNLSGGPRNMLRFRYNSEGSGGIFNAVLSAPSPVRGTLTGFIDSNTTEIDANFRELYVDMGSLWRFLPPQDIIDFLGGIATGSIRIAGTLAEPQFYGTVRGTSLQIMIPQFLPEPIRPVPLTVLLNGTEMTFGPIDAISGQGGGRAAGWFRFDQWIPNIFNIDIRVPQEHPIPFDFDISGVIVNGLASGRIVLAMEDLIFSITGDLTAHDTEISLNAHDLMALETSVSNDDSIIAVIADVSIRAGRRVEFFWPSVDFPVLQAHADRGTGLRITSDTASGRYSLTGDIRLRGGEIFYMERNFYIREGTLFLREDETQFDPRISARAEIRERADIGPVTISMIIDNAPLREFTPRFVSNPSLSQLEIYSLLGQAPHGDGDQRNLAASLAIDSFAQFMVMRRVQRQIRDFMGLDMLSMRTNVLQNVLLQEGGVFSSQEPRHYRVGNFLDNSTIFLGRYLFGAELFGEIMIPFRYDENRLNWGGMVVEPELSLEMRNPLFDVRFSMNFMNPENLFMDDVSISLIWRRSF